MLPELIVAITLASEAIGEPLHGKQMVASVIVNRMMKHGMEAVDVCLQKEQFSWWNKPEWKSEWAKMAEGEAQIELWRITSPEEWADCMELAVKVYNGRFVPLAHVTHYYNPKLCSPKWAKKMKNVRDVGNHRFGLIETK